MVSKSLDRWRGGGVAAVLIGTLLLALLTADTPLPARDEAEPAVLPSDLARIPSDGTLLWSVGVADLWEGEIGKSVRQKLADDIGEAAQAFKKFFGLPLDQVERLTLVLMDPSIGGPPQPLMFLRTTKAYDRAKVIAAVGKDAKEEKHKGQTFFVGDKDKAVFPLDGQTVVYGDAPEIRGLIDHPTPKTEGRLGSALRLAAGKHALVVGVNVKAVNDAIGDKLPGLEPFKSLLQADSATLLLNLANMGGNGTARVAVNLAFPSEEEAKAGLRPLNTGIDLSRAALDQSVKQLAKQKEMDQVVELLKQVQGALKATKTVQEGKTLQASASLKIDMTTVGIMVVEAVQKVRESAARIQSDNNLKQIALAMHNYHDVNGSFPPQATYDKNGKPLLSWRVLILPYLEQHTLYKQFHLNEPWDSEHNKKLLAMMPKIYASPQDENALKDHTTHYQGFVGKGAFFEGKKGIRITDITDGTSNTLMIVEASKAVPWSKPEDLPYDATKPLPKLGLPRTKVFSAAFCDGSVRHIVKTIKPTTLQNIITRNGGEVVNDPDF